nr:MAG: hypothetical protein H3BulkLitter1720873_000002 [Mitovirus sp.]
MVHNTVIQPSRRLPSITSGGLMIVKAMLVSPDLTENLYKVPEFEDTTPIVSKTCS